MKPRKKPFRRRSHRFRLILTLGLAVVLPAIALIFVNLHHVESIKRDKKVEAVIHGDFMYYLGVSEKKINETVYQMVEEVRDQFPSPDIAKSEKEAQLDQILNKHPWIAHAFLYDIDKHLLLRSQPGQMADPLFSEEHFALTKMYEGWFGMEGKTFYDGICKKSKRILWYPGDAKRAGGYYYTTSAYFVFPDLKERVVFGGVTFDPEYLRKTFFPEMLDQMIRQKDPENEAQRLAMLIFPNDGDGGQSSHKAVAASSGWNEGKPEVARRLDGVFSGLALGIKFQGTTAKEIGRSWFIKSLLILAVLSVLMIGGLVMTYRSVSKEMALARLKSDFVSNVSHELRTPLALIRLYAETLELGRLKTQEKKDEYYRIIRKESERLTALINNILDFSRIEAGRKEYDFRETDIAELVRNTLDAYRYQIEQQGFEFEQQIEPNIPAVHVDREAIARALVNLVNNALKYSPEEKFLRVRLYRDNGALKLEVADRGIGITRREQAKIFEKFYRTGDPLVHNTRGSGLGLSLVQHITQAHGGEVEVESTPGKGSKFTLKLPLAEPAAPQERGAKLEGAVTT